MRVFELLISMACYVFAAFIVYVLVIPSVDFRKAPYPKKIRVTGALAAIVLTACAIAIQPNSG